jgi:hypothetical protein
MTPVLEMTAFAEITLAEPDALTDRELYEFNAGVLHSSDQTRSAMWRADR